MLKRAFLALIILHLSVSLNAQEKAPGKVTASQEKSTESIDRTELLDYAKKYIGTPYRSGSMNPKKGFDCSGFVRFVFSHFEMTMPRSSREYKMLGTALKPSDFKEGDILVFYGYKDKNHIGHVGIICEANGMNSKFIHASSGRAKSVTISRLDSEGYRKRFYKCIDVIK